MNHLDFIAWMVLYPLSSQICKAIAYQYCEKREYSYRTQGYAALVEMFIWFFIGYKLF